MLAISRPQDSRSKLRLPRVSALTGVAPRPMLKPLAAAFAKDSYYFHHHYLLLFYSFAIYYKVITSSLRVSRLNNRNVRGR